jgi:hypothetical protein
LPSKLAEWLAKNMQAELAIPAKQGACFTVAELNQILAMVLVQKREGGLLRTWTALEWDVKITGAGQRHVAIHVICQDIVFEVKILRCL